jgi:hypothetical protein
MEQDFDKRLRDLTSRMVRYFPNFAGDIVGIPESSFLTLRDLGVLMLCAPGERVARSAVESLVGAGDADAVIGALTGHGLLKEEDRDNVILTTNGQSFIQRMLDARVQSIGRMFQALPDDARNQFLQSWNTFADAMERSEALVEA